MSEDGTLRLERVEKSDEGEYTCQAINSKGEAQVTAAISVRGELLSVVIYYNYALTP